MTLLTSGLEVGARTQTNVEQAALQGFAASLQLRDNGGALVSGRQSRSSASIWAE